MTTFLIAVCAVAFFMLGLSITLIRKGRNLQSDVGSNDEMRKRGIECASAQIRREEAALRGKNAEINLPCGEPECSDCGIPGDCAVQEK